MATHPEPTEGLPEPQGVEPGGEGVQEQPTTEEQGEPLTVEKLAMDLGWTPQEQFRGDPEKWKPADQFIRDGREIQRTMSRELKEVKDTVSRMSSVSQTLLEQQLSERDSAWQRKMDEAFEAGDKEGFNTAANERAKLRQTTPSNEPPEVRDFKSRNQWYGQNPVASDFAAAVCEAEARKGTSAADQLRIAETEVRKRFPELFNEPQRQDTKPAPAVNQPTSRAVNRSSGKRGFNDMPSDAQKAARDMQTKYGVAPDKYAELYWQKAGQA